MIPGTYWIVETALVGLLTLLFLAFRRLARLKKDRRQMQGGQRLLRDLDKLEPQYMGVDLAEGPDRTEVVVLGRTQRGMPPAEVIHEPVDVNALIKEIDAAWAAHQKEKSE